VGFHEEARAATSEELFRASFEGEYDDETPWEAVYELRRRGGDEVFRLAVTYSRSEEPLRRARALDVLGQLKAGQAPEPAHLDESAAIAISSLNDPSPRVRESAAWALAHLGGNLAISTLIGLRNHADPQVRHAAAFGLAGSERPDAISTLIDLTSDEDDEVRNWATFGLGNAGAEAGPPARLGTLDSPDIRDALRRRLVDSFPEARDEAIWGLARRGDPAALQLLLDRLTSREWTDGDEMAAAEILGVEYRTPVEALRTGLQELLSDK
jgi:HEAT repeat protein